MADGNTQVAEQEQEPQASQALQSPQEASSEEQPTTLDDGEKNLSPQEEIFAALNNEEAEPSAESPSEEPVPPEKVAEAEPSSEPSQEPPSETPPAQSQQPVQELQQPAEQPVAPQEPTPQPLTQEQLEQQFSQWRGTVESELEGRYQMSEELATKFAEEPEAVLPKMAARIHMEVMLSTMNAMAQQLPGMIIQSQQQLAEYSNFETSFYNAWPQLNKSTDTETIRRIGEAYRASNPNAPTEQFIAEVGAAAVVALGKTQQVVEQQPPPVDRPFRPASPGAAASGAQDAKSPMLFEDIMTEDELTRGT